MLTLSTAPKKHEVKSRTKVLYVPLCTICRTITEKVCSKIVKYAIKNIFHKAFTVTNDRNKTKNREFLMRKLVKR